MVEGCVLRGQTYIVDVLFIVNRRFQEQERNIIMETAFVEIFVNHDFTNVVVSVGEELVLSLRVPFTSTNFQRRRVLSLDTVSSLK